MIKRFSACLLSVLLTFAAVTAAYADNDAAGFADVPADAWYFSDVESICLSGIMEGDGDFFYPGKILNRAMLVTVLMRLDESAEKSDEMPFNDVPADAWYYDAVSYAAARGISEGYGDGSFRPLKSVSREEFAVMLYNLQLAGGLEHCPAAESQGFEDSDLISSWARDAMDWAVSSGVLRGSGSLLKPLNALTRAEAAAALNRLTKLSLD